MLKPNKLSVLMLIVLSVLFQSCGNDDMNSDIRIIVKNDLGEPRVGAEVFVVHVQSCEVSESIYTDETGVAVVKDVSTGKNIFIATANSFTDIQEFTIGDSPPEEIEMNLRDLGSTISFLMVDPKNLQTSPGEEVTFVLDVRDLVFVQKTVIEVYDENDNLLVSGSPDPSGNFIFNLTFQERRAYFLTVKAINLLGDQRERRYTIENYAPPRLSASITDIDRWCVSIEWSKYSGPDFLFYEITTNSDSENCFDRRTVHNIYDVDETNYTLNALPLHDSICISVSVRLLNGLTSAPNKPLLSLENPIEHLFDFYYIGKSIVDNNTLITRADEIVFLYDFENESSINVNPFKSRAEILPFKSATMDNVPVVPIASGSQELAFVSPVNGDVIGYFTDDYDITDDFGYFTNGTFCIRVYDDKERIGIHDVKTGELKSIIPHMNDIRGDLWVPVPEKNILIVFATYNPEHDAIIYQFDEEGELLDQKSVDLPWPVNNEVLVGGDGRYIVTRFEGYVLDIENDLEYLGTLSPWVGAMHVAFDKHSTLFATTSFTEDSIRVYNVESLNQINSIKGPKSIEYIQIENRRLYIGINSLQKEGVAILDL